MREYIHVHISGNIQSETRTQSPPASSEMHLRPWSSCVIVARVMKEIPSRDGDHPDRPKRLVLGADSPELYHSIPNWFRKLIAKSLGTDQLHDAEVTHFQQLSQSIRVPYAVFAKELADAAYSGTLSPNESQRNALALDCSILANVCHSGEAIAWLTRAYLRGFYVPSRTRTNEFLQEVRCSNAVGETDAVKKKAEAVAVFVDGILPRPAQLDEATRNRLWNEFDDFLSAPIRHDIIAIESDERQMGGKR